jgi:MFS family permease
MSRFLTPLIIAPLVEHRSTLKNTALGVGLLMRAQVLFMALGGFFLASRSNIISFFVFFSLFHMFMGMQNVVYNTVMAKVIPVETRGRFIGFREFVGSVTASIVALLAGSLFIEKLQFPQSYGAIYLLTFVLTCIGLAFFALSREPATPATHARIPLFERLRSIPTEMWKNRNFANYCACRAVGSIALMANPFFILYIGSKLHVSGNRLGQLTFAWFIAQTTVNLFLGRVADRRGFRHVFLVAVPAWTIAMIVMVVAPMSYPLALAVFVALGVGASGFRMSTQNMVFEFGDTSGLPMRIAIVNSLSELATAIGPLIAGILADTVSYQSVFVISIVCTIVSFAMMFFRITEPRTTPADPSAR